MKKKNMLALVLVLAVMAGCGAAAASAGETILVAAAASLEKALTQELIPMFEAAHPGVHVEGAYDSSGKLQVQIEEGLEADVFLSAAMKQMDALEAQGLVEADSVALLLENRLVLIAPVDSDTEIDSFARIVEAESIAMGDPESVPAGQYAREAFTSLGVYEEVVGKASLGGNVTEVLHWVAEGSAEVGVVYATDAMQLPERVRVLCEVPEGSLAQKVTYPAGIIANSPHQDAARAFVAFLQSEEAAAVFESYGFSRP